MKIVLAEHFGMCFGVRDAIAQAVDLAEQGPLTILGELVHNPIVRERLRAQGVAEGSLDQSEATSGPVMITAHGTSDAKRAAWRENGFHVVDGTCPLVRHAHEQLKRLVAAGYFPVVIGKVGHVEVRGLTEDFPEARVVDLPSDISEIATARSIRRDFSNDTAHRSSARSRGRNQASTSRKRSAFCRYGLQANERSTISITETDRRR